MSKIQKCLDFAEYVENNKKLKKRKDWITKVVDVSCEKKEVLYKIMENNPNNNILRTEFKRYVKIIYKVIKNAEIQYNGGLLKDRNKNDAKKLLKVINT